MDIAFALFNVIELLGSGGFEGKRIAYVLVPILVKEGRNSELVTLLPNVYRKEFKEMGADPFSVSAAAGCLARVCNEELASLLYPDLIPLYTCSKALIRRKICVLTFKMFFYCSDSIPELLPYLSDRLKDTKTGV